MIKINTKFTITPLLWARLIIMSVTSILLIGLTFFLYRDFYQTIIQSETVLVLKREVAARDIEIDLFKRVRFVDEYKITNVLPKEIMDVFGVANAPTNNAPAAAMATSTLPSL